MDIPPIDPDYLDKIRKVHDYAIREKEATKARIESAISDIDAIELLAHLSFISQFVPEDNPEVNQSMRVHPSQHYLAGLFLNKHEYGTRPPKNDDLEALVEDIDRYFLFFVQDLTLQSFKKNVLKEEDKIILQARIQKMIRQTSAMMYPFQIDALINGVFSHFDEYFYKTVGFRATKALEYGIKIINRYERKANERYDEVGEAQKRAADDLKDPVRGSILRANLKSKLSDEDLLTSYTSFLLFTNVKELFLFEPESLCREEGISERTEFANYVSALSCQFGSNKDFNSPLDSNVIYFKPFIKMNDGTYFVPVFHDLLHNLSLILESLLEKEKQIQSGIWQRYQTIRASFTENRIFDFLSRLFPEGSIFKNAKYKYQGNDCEADIIVIYDNKIFLIEAKAGSFGEQSQRGGLQSLKQDLKKLIEEAYNQGRRTADYLKASDISVFFDSHGKKIIEVKGQEKKIFIISVTLEPLMSLAVGLKNLRSLGLFIENEYPWSVQINELDLVTRHLPSPTIFIHYLESRLRAIDENIFHAYDELSFLGWYLKMGNFLTPRDENNKKPGLLEISSEWTKGFDEHYLFGKTAPKLDIENDLFKMIRILEILNPVGYSDIACALLDFDHEARKLIIAKINELIELSKKDRESHDFSVVYKDELDTGLSFMTYLQRDGLKERLISYCAIKKYQYKTKKWLGVGRDVSDNRWLVNEFAFSDFPWEHNSKMDELLRAFPIRDKST